MTEATERIAVVHADITTLAVDAIVNAANESLLGGGGVDGAIHRAAGPKLLDECREIGGCPTGEARITARLRAARALRDPHRRPGLAAAARPASRACSAPATPSRCALARQNGIETIAFPAISTGVYGYPIEAATVVAVRIGRGVPGRERRAARRDLLLLLAARRGLVYERVLATFG